MVNTLGSEDIFNWLINNNVCILNTNQPTHAAYFGSLSLIDFSFSSADIFRISDTYAHPDLFDSYHCPTTHNITYTMSTYLNTSTDWAVVEGCLNRNLDHSVSNLSRASIRTFKKGFIVALSSIGCSGRIILLSGTTQPKAEIPEIG